MPHLSTPQPLPPGPLLVNALPASVQAGFPSPAEDHQVERIDLMHQLIKHPQATFMLRVSGHPHADVDDDAVYPREALIGMDDDSW